MGAEFRLHGAGCEGGGVNGADISLMVTECRFNGD
jgi:hypothetical protein